MSYYFLGKLQKGLDSGSELCDNWSIEINKPLTNWKKAMIKATTFSSKKMTDIEFFNWMDFFRGTKVTVGKGKTVWLLSSGFYQEDNRQARVTLKRETFRNGVSEGMVKTTVNAERVRYFDGEGYLMASGNYEISNGTIKLIGS